MISLGEVDSDKLQTAIQTLLEKHTLYRIKGFAALPNKPMRQVLQAVGNRLDVYFDRLWAPDEARQTQLVFIGKGFNKASLETTLATAVIRTEASAEKIAEPTGASV